LEELIDLTGSDAPVGGLFDTEPKLNGQLQLLTGILQR
jgi:hypothetical protein